MNLQDIINTPGVSIVDVRTPFEYGMGHVEDSLNIPLDQVADRLEDFRALGRPLVLCCASGNRSGQATRFLQQQGLEEVYNGGGWAEVQSYQKEKA